MKIGKALPLDTSCPWCGHIHDLVSIVEGTPQIPDDGDIGLCIRCGEWIVYDKIRKNGMRKPNHEEYEFIATDKVTTALRAAWFQSNVESVVAPLFHKSRNLGKKKPPKSGA